MSNYLSYGKLKFTIAAFPDTEWTYSYSAKELQEELNMLFSGQKVNAVYVGLDGYLESLHWGKDYIDLSYMGGTSLVVFDKVVLQVAIHVEGMIEYRHFPIWEMRLREVFDYPPDDMLMSDKYFYNAADHEISHDYAGQEVKAITVKGTNTWAFSQPTFDETIAEVAAKKNDLPTEIDILMSTCIIRFVGDELEYYWVFFEEPHKNEVAVNT